MSSDSDSAEEICEDLKEAQDYELFSNSLYSTALKESSRSTLEDRKKILTPSLKNAVIKEDQFNGGFDVTPEFRTYVSKKLVNVLEKKLESSYKSVSDLKSYKDQSKTGIKLFSNSKKYIQLTTTDDQRRYKSKISKPQLKPHYPHPISNDDFKEISVTGQFILSREELKHWSNRSKSQVFHYKERSDGQLVSSDLK